MHLSLSSSTFLEFPIHKIQATNGHIWYVHKGFTEGNGTCTDTIGALYNPYGVSTTTESGYLNDCTSRSQQRCAMGDLSGKLGTLGLEPMANTPRKTYAFYDENLHLVGPFSGEFKIHIGIFPSYKYFNYLCNHSTCKMFL